MNMEAAKLGTHTQTHIHNLHHLIRWRGVPVSVLVQACGLLQVEVGMTSCAESRTGAMTISSKVPKDSLKCGFLVWRTHIAKQCALEDSENDFSLT